jgi:hypothetical protein
MSAMAAFRSPLDAPQSAGLAQLRADSGGPVFARHARAPLQGRATRQKGAQLQPAAGVDASGTPTGRWARGTPDDAGVLESPKVGYHFESRSFPVRRLRPP